MDYLLRLWLKNKKHLSKGVMGLFVLLTCGVIYLFLQDQNVQPPVPTQPRNWEPKDIVTPETVDFLTTYTAPVDPIHESDLAIISALSAWEVRQGQSAEELERQAIQFLNDAKRERSAGNLRRARGALNRALSLQPNFQEARNLLNQIDREIRAGE